MAKNGNKEKKTAGAEKFGANLYDKLEKVTGNWEKKDDIEVTAFDKKIIYRSPEEPSHVAWVGMWRKPNGPITIRFPQITGNPGLDQSYAPWYGRLWQKRNIKSWEEFCEKHNLLIGPSDALETTDLNYVTMESNDNGDTWKKLGEGKDGWGNNTKPIFAPNGEPIEGGMSTVVCKDGRILQAIGSIKEWQKIKKKLGPKGKFFIALRESFDNGKTWTEFQALPLKSKKDKLGGCEELAMVELSDSRILVLFRLEKPLEGGVAQAYLKKGKDGKYTASIAEKTIMPHAGKPDMVKCGDGTIWYWGAGHFYTLDEGKKWHHLPPETYFIESYYGKMLAAGKNRIICVSQKDISDSPYPHTFDGGIEQSLIEYKRTCAVKQNQSDSSLALTKLKGKKFGDLHLKVDVKVDRVEGVAFGISPDNSSYYVFAIVRSEEELRKRWSPPPTEGQTLSAWHLGLQYEHVRERVEKGLSPTNKLFTRPLAVIAKVENGKITVLRGIAAPMINNSKAVQEIKKGTWIQMQIKVSGNLLQCSFYHKGSHCGAVYLGINASEYTGGAVGLFTDAGSQGEFKNLYLWKSPQMIRDLWD